MSWKKTLTPYQRERIKDLHHIKPAWNLVPFAFVGIWAAAGALVLAYPFWPVRVVGYVIIGASIHALAVLQHDALHGSIFRKRLLDRWAGFLLFVPVALSAYAYRMVHLLHHKHTRSEHDPYEYTNLVANRKAASVSFYAWPFLGALFLLFQVPVTGLLRGSRRDRLNILLEYALIAAIYTGVFLLAARYAFTDALIHCWLIPLLVTFVIAQVRVWAEHAMTSRGSPLVESRTVTSNRIVSFFMVNFNYHLEHHLYPSVPWYNLPKLHKLLQLQYRMAGASIYRSYIKLVWDAARTGVHGTAMGAR